MRVTAKVLFFRYVYMMQHRWYLTVCYCLFPLILLLFTVCFYSVFPYEEYKTTNKTFTERFLLNIQKQVEIVVCPGGDGERQLMNNVQRILHLVDGPHPNGTTPLVITFVNDTRQMEDLLVSLNSDITYGVHFHAINSTTLEYSIRPQAFNIPLTEMDWGDYRTMERFPSPMYRGPRPSDPYFEVPISGSPGLLRLQVAIDKAYIDARFSETALEKTWAIISFPYHVYMDVGRKYINTLTHRFVLLCVQYLIIIAILFMISVFASYTIRDKMSGVREMLSANGAHRWMVNLSWLVFFCLEATILAIAEMGILKIPTRNGALIQYMSASALSIVLVVYNFSSVCWVFFIAAIITNDVLCISVVISYWLISPILLQWIPPGFFTLQASLAPLPNAGMVLIFKSFQEFDGAETTVDLNHLSTSPIHYWPIGDFLLIMAATSVLLVLLSAYVDIVKPGPYGRARPWHLLTRKYKATVNSSTDETSESIFFDHIKKEDPIGLECVGISKFFGKIKAVDNVNMKILKDKVTVIIGNNGAGKTSFISILCGMYSPTRGALFADGYDVFKGSNIKRWRKVLGCCPQSNILLSELTFQQNLIIFSMLKGLSHHQAEEYCGKWTAMFHTEECRTRQVKYLSGGDKRKLSLAIALSGNPQYLLLDNPTSGLDSKSKRKFWNIILQKKVKCTVVLTTCNMDEAEILGDRIVCLRKGQLKAHTSSSLLKKKLDIGHIVTFSVSEGDLEKLIRIMISLSAIEIVSQTKRSVAFWLPMYFKLKDIPRLLKSLESEFGEGISSAVSYVTTEDIVIRFLDMLEEVKVEEVRVEEHDINQSCCKCIHVKETLKKRLKWSLNQSLTLITVLVLLLPLIGMALAIYVTNRTLGRSSYSLYPTDLKFSMDKYSGTVGIISKSRNEMNEAIKAAMMNSGIKYKEVEMDIIDYLGFLGSEDLFKYRSNYVFGFDATTKEVNGYFSRNAFHSAPIAYSVVINAILNGNATIVTHNFPFVKKQGLSACEFANAGMVVLLLLTLLGPMLLIAGSYFILFPHIERRTLFKQLQLMAGLLPAVYWFSNLLFDMVMFSVSCVLMIITVYIMDIYFFWNVTALCVLFLVLLLYGLSTIAFAYVWSFCRCSIATVVTWYFIINSFLIPGTWILDFDGYFYFLPGVTLMNSLGKISVWAERSRQCHECEDVESCADIQGSSLLYSLKSNLFAFLFAFLGYFAAIVAMDHGFGRRLKPIVDRVWYGGTIKNGVCCPEISLEKARVRDLDTGETEEHPELVCDGLGKKYSSKITAVRDFTFATDRGEVFGLLGPNGSGKTTIFGILAGMVSQTKGTATIRGKWELSDCEYKYIRNIGYCPQFDGLLPGLSGRTTLTLFGRLRGLKEHLLAFHVEKWLEVMGMKSVAHRPCEEYSGGTRRKLNFVIAMIVRPSVVLLDEPLTGIDTPFQKVIRRILLDVDQTRRQAIVLTTHNMVECETLCDRLAIVVNGVMKCIGSIPELKKSLGKTCVLLVKFIEDTTPTQLNNVQFKIEFRFAGYINLQAKPHNRLIYNIATEKHRIYDVFSFMLKIREENPAVDDFSITEAPLEDIYTMCTRRE